jgi:hypothetical protein
MTLALPLPVSIVPLDQMMKIFVVGGMNMPVDLQIVFTRGITNIISLIPHPDSSGYHYLGNAGRRPARRWNNPTVRRERLIVARSSIMPSLGSAGSENIHTSRVNILVQEKENGTRCRIRS